MILATVQEAGEEADNRGIQTVAGELVEVIEEDDIQVSARERDLEELELVLNVLPPEVAAILRSVSYTHLTLPTILLV